MRGLRHTLRLDADAKHRSSAIGKLAVAERERPGRPVCVPIDTLGHAVHRAITENA